MRTRLSVLRKCVFRRLKTTSVFISLITALLFLGGRACVQVAAVVVVGAIGSRFLLVKAGGKPGRSRGGR